MAGSKWSEPKVEYLESKSKRRQPRRKNTEVERTFQESAWKTPKAMKKYKTLTRHQTRTLYSSSKDSGDPQTLWTIEKNWFQKPRLDADFDVNRTLSLKSKSHRTTSVSISRKKKKKKKERNIVKPLSTIKPHFGNIFKRMMATTQECCEQFWTSPGDSTPQSTNCTAINPPSRKLSKLDEPNMQDTAGEAGTSS